MAHFLDGVTWEELPSPCGERDTSLPYATHQGVLHIGKHALRCYQLNTGQSIFHKDDFDNFFDGLGGADVNT